jgi:hypothetical protein
MKERVEGAVFFWVMIPDSLFFFFVILGVTRVVGDDGT